MVEAGIEKAVAKVIENQFKSYGSVSKALDEAVKEGLRIDTTIIDFDSYNAQMLALVKGKLGEMFVGKAAEHFVSQLDDMLTPAPKEINVGAFLELIAAAWKTDEPWNCDNLDERMTVETEDHDFGGFTFNLWKKRNEHSYHSGSADLQLYFTKDGVLRISHRQSFNPTCLNKAEALVFKFYGAGTKFTGVSDFCEDDWDLVLIEHER